MKPVLGILAALAVVAGACGGDERVTPTESGGPDGRGDCTPTGVEVCEGDLDEDCDGKFDCQDSDCSGVGDCPTCGALDLTEGQPLALPDGEGSSYQSSIDFTGFSDGQILQESRSMLGVCVVMEHSWLRDLQIELTCPTGQQVVLQQFLGQEGFEVKMGVPNDNDGTNPVPGTGAEYCWTPDATRPPMLTYATQQNQPSLNLPPGDYQSAGAFTGFEGCTLNGPWAIKVTDLWADDTGFLFSWGVKFDAALVADCDAWVE
jgi:subtilisin-like proprotein convertase family protein